MHGFYWFGGKGLPPVFKRPERIFSTHAPTLVGASGLGQGPGNYCHQEIGGTAERRLLDEDLSSPPSRGSQDSARSRLSKGLARAESAGDIGMSRGSSRSRLSRTSSALLRQEIHKAAQYSVAVEPGFAGPITG
eukprot:Skav201362  [mRNA]  locus=scaffold2471:150799:153168:+ [translate_table: standard]